MKQLALARRYRPRSFQTLVGQEITLQALTNALDTQRLHHAYLFTGTRGVGKTSIARILAKCLNCEQGISSNPCGNCETCQAIDGGRFVDLIEVDAASRTKVEDTRELLDNVQYLPTQGRFKIYLIDEVHMLSGHSFNALLKTLEEPPAHVKFLLATTDPQKLPITILSRCLQFHLRRLPTDKIVQYLTHILQQEGSVYENAALQEIGIAADGSLRDALSLLDQALNYGNGAVETLAVRTMLGIPERARLLSLLTFVVNGDSRQVLQEISGLTEDMSDFGALLIELLTVIHQITIAQSVPEALDETVQQREEILKLASIVTPEEIQLYYQIGLQGHRDLSFAPNPKMGFEMTLLRMVAFRPITIASPDVIPQSMFQPVVKSVAQPVVQPIVQPVETTVSAEFKQPEKPVIEQSATETENPSWHILIEKLNLSGLSKILAQHCTVTSLVSDRVQLVLEESQKHLLTKRYEDRLREALCQYFGTELQLQITLGKVSEQTPAVQNQQRTLKAQAATQSMIDVDSKIQQLIQTFDAKIEKVFLKDD